MVIRHRDETSISMDVVSKTVSRDSLSVRKRRATSDRIATTAAALVASDGLARTTVEQIAETAEVGRATFFRHFRSKKDAVAEGLTKHWLDSITAALARQREGLSAADAVRAAFAELGDGSPGSATRCASSRR
jgi:AcrR family transcriptional regulator